MVGSEGGTVYRPFQKRASIGACGCITPRCGHVAGRLKGLSFLFCSRGTGTGENVRPNRALQCETQNPALRVAPSVPVNPHLLNKVWLPRRHEGEGRSPVARRRMLGGAIRVGLAVHRNLCDWVTLTAVRYPKEWSASRSRTFSFVEYRHRSKLTFGAVNANVLVEAPKISNDILAGPAGYCDTHGFRISCVVRNSWREDIPGPDAASLHVLLRRCKQFRSW